MSDVLTNDEFRDLDQIVARLNEPRRIKVATDRDFEDAVDALTALPRLLAEIRRLRAELAYATPRNAVLISVHALEAWKRMESELTGVIRGLHARVAELERRGGGDGG